MSIRIPFVGTFICTVAPPPEAHIPPRRTPSGNWVLSSSPAPPYYSETLDLENFGYNSMLTALTEPGRPREYADPRELAAGARELGLPNPLPMYCHEADEPNEPDTIAKKLFIFGFMFPLLWLVGACILCVPLHAYPLPPTSPDHPDNSATTSPTSESSAPEYTKDPRPANLDTVWTQPLIDLYGRAERHWAWRCVWALTSLCLLGTTIACALMGMRVI
ncbi:hypothetical protein DACRYDRAFT_117521 [Dacryopinax primogenitus]|uniref:Uncharacterized protein n=1 Tax=Dacryopinax primogenitus (strain DJM 731) TaxID=1858805 RepID=M5FW54_DACPD|nr:uncharacterized protein DACRYDRAFT_117521 [Dacryopinax primogenitus]EJT99894.1 hypothetical protein DACRYDRAFT_117521 [Dacryopinax primogenitus]